MDLIHGPLGYGSSTLPLCHSAPTSLLKVKSLAGMSIIDHCYDIPPSRYADITAGTQWTEKAFNSPTGSVFVKSANRQGGKRIVSNDMTEFHIKAIKRKKLYKGT